MEERIIGFVRENRCIYDKKHGRYRNQIYKHKKWMELSKELNVSVDSLKKRWKCLRDRFFRLRKTDAYTSDSGIISPDKKKYKHYDSLLFLCDVESTSTNIRRVENFEAENWDAEDCDTDNFGSRESLVDDVASCSAFNIAETFYPAPSNSVCKRDDAEDPLEDEMISVVKSVKSSTEQKQNIPFRAFLESVALTVEKANLGITEVMSIQVNILNVIQNEIMKYTR